MSIQHERNTSVEISDDEALSRRGLLRSAAILAGGAVLGSTLLQATVARAQGADTTGGDAMTTDGMAATDPTRMTASGGSIPGFAKAGKDNIAPAKIVNDIAILNSALLLEYLEAEFYTRVVAADEQRPFLQGRVRDVARILRRDETTHVQTVSEMIQKLGGTPLEKPGFQFPGDVFISSIAFLRLSAMLEETGVGAYLGAAPKLQSKNVLKFAASIYGNEARHTALIHYLQGDIFAPRDLEMPITIEEAVARANPYIVKDAIPPTATS